VIYHEVIRLPNLYFNLVSKCIYQMIAFVLSHVYKHVD